MQIIKIPSKIIMHFDVPNVKNTNKNSFGNEIYI